jgi:hypothetical protein
LGERHPESISINRSVYEEPPMSVPHFGRITPIQGDMLGLGGVVTLHPDEEATEEDRISEMRRSLNSLRKETGRDFGYDLEAWHKYLLDSDAHREEYTFPYAWRAVQAKIMELIPDSDRLRLVHQIVAGDHGDGG